MPQPASVSQWQVPPVSDRQETQACSASQVQPSATDSHLHPDPDPEPRMRTLLIRANHLTGAAVSVWYPKTSLLVSAVAAVKVHAAAPVVLPMAVTVMLMPVAEAVP